MRILVVTGSSGGHIFPALSFLENLSDKHKEVSALLALPRHNRAQKPLPAGLNVRYLSITRIPLDCSLESAKGLFNFLKGCFESLFILLEFRPDIVVGFGSLNSVPLVWLAWLFRIKTMIHEQNVSPGRANRLLAKFCDKIAISFDRTKDYLKGASRKIVLTGNPVRKALKEADKKEALDFFGLESGKFTLLVMGGSAGSHKINFSFQKALVALADFQAIHISGEKDYPLLEDNYRESNAKVKLFAFLGQMQYAYSAADLAICRAGATTVAELVRFALPALIVPYPFAYRHQFENARVLERQGAACIVKDEELDANSLQYFLRQISEHPGRLEAMRRAYGHFTASDAADLLAQAALSLELD
jgi:UDP-N-acetylglucosamine--N-acetylmuramyl-(pentapeptide) pyrophosphoryl-undecaprenol N-acetylglucosamine transferase